jgi:hypothetical protein
LKTQAGSERNEAILGSVVDAVESRVTFGGQLTDTDLNDEGIEGLTRTLPHCRVLCRESEQTTPGVIPLDQVDEAEVRELLGRIMDQAASR